MPSATRARDADCGRYRGGRPKALPQELINSCVFCAVWEWTHGEADLNASSLISSRRVGRSRGQRWTAVRHAHLLGKQTRRVYGLRRRCPDRRAPRSEGRDRRSDGAADTGVSLFDGTGTTNGQAEERRRRSSTQSPGRRPGHRATSPSPVHRRS